MSVSYSKYFLFLLPIIELIIFIEIGSLIGSFSVVLSIFITIFLGYYLIKQKLRYIGLTLFDIGNIQNMYEQYTNNIYSIDIDNQEDFNYAKYCFEMINKSQN